MAASTTPIFTAVPHVGIGKIITANTNRDGTGSIVDIFIAGANGSRVEHVDIEAQSSTTAGMVRLFMSDGVTYWLIREYLVTAITPSSTVKAFFNTDNFSLGSNVLMVPFGYKLGAATSNGEAFNIIAVGGDF